MLKLFVKPVWFTLLLAMMTTLFFGSSTVMADEAVSEPQALVKDASDRMLQALKDNEDKIEEDPKFVYGLVNDILLPNFDFAKMSKLALGKNWRKANPAQRERFIGEFRLLLVRTYTTAMVEYSDEEIVFLPFRDDLAKKRVKVAMEVLQPGGPSIPIALSMYLNKQNAWKVYDVKIDGISLVTNYRSTFAAEIRKEGMEKLIDNLAARNEKVKA
jgi:phospholipid transport system substrate-binding protein